MITHFVVVLALIGSSLALDAKYDSSNDFDKVDSDKNSRISLAEFLNWRGAQGQPKTIRLFKSYDVNGDGELNVSEFVPLVFALNRSPVSEGEKLFKLLDLNGDGILIKSEVDRSKEQIPAEITTGLFQVADVNNDGDITLHEFLSIIDSQAAVEQSKNVGTAKTLMLAMDTDGDKRANKGEVRAFANKFNRVSEGELNVVFQHLDLDRDNYLSVSELEKLPSKITELAGIREMPLIKN